jgi:hypothetical protein
MISLYTMSPTRMEIIWLPWLPQVKIMTTIQHIQEVIISFAFHLCTVCVWLKSRGSPTPSIGPILSFKFITWKQILMCSVVPMTGMSGGHDAAPFLYS